MVDTEYKAKRLEIDSKDFEVEDLKPAVVALKKGGIIAYPTETVYGLGASIFHQKAIQKIFGIKRRDPHKPISAMISSLEIVDGLCTEIPEYARTLMDLYWPGPLTLVLKASQNMPRYMTCSERKIGLRFPDHPITRALMVHHQQPITSTSANMTGSEPPITATELDVKIQSQIDMIVDAGPCTIKIPSTVIDCAPDGPKLLRQGSITFAEIEESLQRVNG
ncbi:MAG: L-threonylcarbamoyladenylate synthase [bacterium]